MNSSCKICEKTDEKKIIVLPFCGYGICYDHFVDFTNSFNCPVCNDHVIVKDECFKMRINSDKIDLIKLERNENIRQNPELFIEDIFVELIKEVDLRRERIMVEVKTKVDEYYQQLIDEINARKNDLADEFYSKMENYDENRISIGAIIEGVESLKLLHGQGFYNFKVADYFGRINFSSLKNKDSFLVDLANFKTKRSINADYYLSYKFVDQFETGEILVCTDYHIQIFDQELRQKLKEIKLHNQITCVKIFNSNEIVCGFENGSFKLINKNKGQIVNQIESSNNLIPDINALEIWSNKIVTRTCGQIKVWDMDKKSYLFESRKFPFGKNLLMINSNHLLCFDRFSMVIFDLSNKKISHKIYGNELVDADKLNDEEFASVHESGLCQIWCSNTFECKLKFDTKMWNIRNIIALPNQKFLINSNKDGITLWTRNETVFTSQLKLKFNAKCIKVLKSGDLIVSDCSPHIYLLSKEI